MIRRCSRVAVVTFLAALVSAAAAPAADPEPVDREPLLRLETDGPTSLVTALAFRPDGRVLYEAGWDKVVRAWSLGAGDGGFRLDPRSTLRVPIGPGLVGAINAMALSPDGRWLAVASNGVIPGAAGFRQTGLIIPRRGLSDDQRRAQGEIFVFDTSAVAPRCRRLRGHLGPVLALTFVESAAGAPTVLASIATEPGEKGVVRLWNVDRGEYLDGVVGPTATKYRPGLAAWRVREARGAIRVAATWGDAKSHAWDFALDGHRTTVGLIKDDTANQALVHLADRAIITTGGFDMPSRQGRLRFWDAANLRVATGFPGVPLSLEANGSGMCVPRAAALVATRPGGPLDTMAVVVQEVREDSPDREYTSVLLLIDLQPGRIGAVRARARLWRGQNIQPVIAAVARGRHVAVAGNIDRSVAVFAVDDLLAGRLEPRWLRNQGVTMRAVAFARNGARRGLIMSELPVNRPGDPPRPLAARDMVLDATEKRLTSDLAGWSVAAPPAGEWRAEEGSKSGTITVRGSGSTQRQVVVPLNNEVTALAVLPPLAGVVATAVVAVGLNEPGSGPSLWLYDAVGGAPIRQLAGHSGRVRGLAFSSDGLELASAADDQTVAVWNLRDLGEVLGRRGGLTGVELVGEKDHIVVTTVPAESEYRDTLREGDVLLGIVERGEMRALATPDEFFKAISRVPPGGSVTVRRRRQGFGESDVALRLGQAADERKPLFSVFVSDGKGKAAGARSWLAWSPLGPYESSGVEVESFFGWHFNTGQPETPTRFALATEYRDLKRPNLLNDLLERGVLPPPPAPPPLPTPKLSLVIDPDVAPDGLGHLFLRRLPAGLAMNATTNAPPADRIASATWQLDDGPSFPLKPAAAGRWSAEPAAADWGLGVHRLTATLRTKEDRPQTFIASRVVRVQPSAPAVDSDLPGRMIDVTEPLFKYRARVVAHERTSVKISLIALGEKGVVFKKDWKTEQPLAIEEKIELPQGVTVFTLVAVNEGALAGFESFETTRLGPISVTYRRRPARPPTIALTSVVPLSSGTADGARLMVVDDQPVVVDVPRIRVEGTVSAEAPLSAAERFLDDPKAVTRLDWFVADRGKTFAVNEVFTLHPGLNTVGFRARAEGDGEWRDLLLPIEFRPPAPGVESLALEPRDETRYLSPEGKPPTVRVVAKLSGFIEGAVLDRAAVVVNNVERPEPAEFDRDASVVTAVVTLKPGPNEIQVRMRNRWGASRTTEPEKVFFARPPRVLAIECPAPVDKPLVNVVARVASPSSLTRAEVEIQSREPGSDRAPVRRFDMSVVGQENDVWTLAARELPIEPGESQVTVRAWNEEGPAREPGPEAKFVFRKPTPERPLVELLSPSDDSNTGQSTVRVRFRVLSAGPLLRAVLVRDISGSRLEPLATADVKKTRRDDSGRFELVMEADVNLLQGVNRLRAEAVNEGGERFSEVNITYVPPPVWLVVERIESFGSRMKAIKPVADLNAPGRFAATELLPSGRVVIHGSVGMDEPVMGRPGDAKLVIWVDGFPQVVATLVPRPGSSHEAEFRAELLLPRESNEVELRLQEGLARELGDRTAIAVRCEVPAPDQKLHLLVIGVGVKQVDESKLRDRALEALRGKLLPGSLTKFETPAFPQGEVYAVLCGEVYATKVEGQLGNIQENVVLGKRPSNDVIVIYYQGTETVDERDRVCLRLCTQYPDRIAVEDIIACFARTRGATLLLLDVDRAPGEPPGPLAASPPWPEGDPRFGLLRFIWRGQGASPRGSPPDDARLITALQDAMPEAMTLGDVATRLAVRAGDLTTRYPNLGFDQFLPGKLTGVIVGGPKK
jgi:WD40 repeat protein